MFKTYWFLLLFGYIISCSEKEVKLGSTGSSNDLLIVCDSLLWSGIVGDEIRSFFQQECVGLPQLEPTFDIIHLRPKSFHQVFKRYRNIIILDINKVHNNKIQFFKDRWAKNQYVCTIALKDIQSFLEIFDKYKHLVLEKFKQSELKRISKYITTQNHKKIFSDFPLKLYIDNLFTKAKAGENYIFYRKNKRAGNHNIYMGVSSYWYHTSVKTILGLKDSVSIYRNRFSRQAIKGAKNAVMQVYSDYALDYKILTGLKQEVLESRGLWNMSKGFMGGPFLNYLILDTTLGKVVGLDAFVYAPKFDKRDLLFELEASLYKTIVDAYKTDSSGRK